MPAIDRVRIVRETYGAPRRFLPTNSRIIEKDVSLVHADHRIDEEIDQGYRAQYGRYAASGRSSPRTPQDRTTSRSSDKRGSMLPARRRGSR